MKVTLEELRLGACNFSCLEKRVLAQIGTFTTVSTILYFLRDEGYVYKESSESRASYRMSARGEKLLDMGLLKEEEEDALHHSSSSSKFELPKELPRGHSAKTD